MYKQMKMYGDLVRLVKQYFPEHLDATHQALAKVIHLLDVNSSTVLIGRQCAFTHIINVYFRL